MPPADFLKKTIHYFTDPKIGMVQTRWGHMNRDYSLLTRMQAMFLDGHFVLEQTARCRQRPVLQLQRHGGVWRRRCIEDAGGWEHDTLTEDLDLSYRAQIAVAVRVSPDVVRPGGAPVDMNGFKTQQHRWTKGSIQTCHNMPGDLACRNSAAHEGRGGAPHRLPLLPCLCVLHFRQPAMSWPITACGAHF